METCTETLDLVVDLLSDMICQYLSAQHKLETEKQGIFEIVHRKIEKEEEEFMDHELTAKLLGSHDFVRVA